MIEFILDDLLRTDSFKTHEREELWRYLWIARRFMEENLPFWEMEPADELSRGRSDDCRRHRQGKIGSAWAAGIRETRRGVRRLFADRLGDRHAGPDGLEGEWPNSAGSIRARASLSALRPKSPAAQSGRSARRPQSPTADWVVLIERTGAA